MGFGVHRFAGSVDDNLLCGVCSGVLEAAVLTPCGHSFCYQCLNTWLDNPNVDDTCPECRSRVTSQDVRPIHSIRNFIKGLEASCTNVSRGCQKVLKLDVMESHLTICGHAAVDCAGCGLTVNREDLSHHHSHCEAIIAILDSTRADKQKTNHKLSKSQSDWFPPTCDAKRHEVDPYVCDLTYRVTSLEIQLHKMKTDLDIADSRNRKLDRELNKTRAQLEDKRIQLLDHHLAEFDPEYEYGYTPKSIVKLSCLLSKFLWKKPVYIDHNLIYNSIKRCYENYAKVPTPPSSVCGVSGDKSASRPTLGHLAEVQMLLATANVSNWFTDSQKLTFTRWLQAAAERV